MLNGFQKQKLLSDTDVLCLKKNQDPIVIKKKYYPYL